MYLDKRGPDLNAGAGTPNIALIGICYFMLIYSNFIIATMLLLSWLAQQNIVDIIYINFIKFLLLLYFCWLVIKHSWLVLHAEEVWFSRAAIKAVTAPNVAKCTAPKPFKQCSCGDGLSCSHPCRIVHMDNLVQVLHQPPEIKHWDAAAARLSWS